MVFSLGNGKAGLKCFTVTRTEWVPAAKAVFIPEVPNVAAQREPTDPDYLYPPPIVNLRFNEHEQNSEPSQSLLYC